jgi:HSP20 family protein
MEGNEMALVRWNPWGELDTLHSQMDQLFQQVFGEQLARNGGDTVSLPVDIRQTDNAFVLEASVPGFRPEDVEVTFDNGILTIKGERSDEAERKEGDYVRRERRAASVYRQVSLPSEVEAERISAGFENGVLSITVPRTPKAQPKRIPVATGRPNVVEAPRS